MVDLLFLEYTIALCTVSLYVSVFSGLWEKRQALLRGMPLLAPLYWQSERLGLWQIQWFSYECSLCIFLDLRIRTPTPLGGAIDIEFRSGNKLVAAERLGSRRRVSAP